MTTINLGRIKFVKAVPHRVNPFKSTLEKVDAGYIVDNRVEGVAIIPYRHGTNGKEILIRDEYNPLRQTVLSLVRGRKDPEDGNGLEWWRVTARRELLEEAGILAEERWFSYVGELLPQANYKNTDILVIVDVTGIHQGRPITDGSIWEKKSTNMWVSIYDVLRMIKEPNQMDNYLLSGLTLFLNWCGLINPMGKSEDSDLEKAKKGEQKPGHKYIRREGQPGKYKYIYTEPKAKGSKKEDDKKGKGGIMEQLAALLGKRQGPSEEKKPKKQLPFDEFTTIPKDMPNFRKNMTATQWVAELDRMVSQVTGEFISSIDDADRDLLNDPKSKRFYADDAIDMLDELRSKYAASESSWSDLVVENKKFNDNAQNEVKKGILRASAALAKVNHMNVSFNSSVFENIFGDFDSKLDAGANPNVLDKMVTVVRTISMHLRDIGKEINDLKWLQGSDSKLDWMVDSTFEAVDKLMQVRNRFVKNSFKFYINRMYPMIESLKDAEEINLAVKMLENFENFKFEAIQTSHTSRGLESFANQWNLKEKGIYDGAARFSSYASSKLVDKVRSLDSLGDDKIVQNYVNSLAKSTAFTFLSMGETTTFPFGVSEQIFSYINLHGMKRYYEDTIFLAGGRSDYVRNDSEHYKKIVSTLTKAYNGEDVYWDDDILYNSERWGGIGNMKPGYMCAPHTAMNMMILLNDETPISSKLPAFIRTWSSVSHGSLMSNIFEEFVSAEDIDRSSYVNYHIASNRTIMSGRQSIKDSMLRTAKQIYEETQRGFENSYVNPEGTNVVRLYRGNGDNEVKSVASSWTTRDDVAAQFGHSITTIEAPVESIFLAHSEDDRDFWTFPSEREHIVVPGLLPANKQPIYDELPDSYRQNILDEQLEEEAMKYGGDY